MGHIRQLKSIQCQISLYAVMIMVLTLFSCSRGRKDKAIVTATAPGNPDIKTTPLTLSRNDLVTTWNTRTITIPTHPGFSGAYNYKVDWDNDGIFDQEGITGDVTHTFDTNGEHTIRISGDFPAVYFHGASKNTQKSIVTLDQWGTIAWHSMERAFAHCSNLDVKATDAPDLSKVENMAFMFAGSGLTNPDLCDWDTSNVTDMNSMFKETSAANPDVSRWNTSNVTRMNSMFNRAFVANPNVSNWDTGNVTNMSYMFTRTIAANPDVSGWDTRKATNIKFMFYSAHKASPDVSSWNTGKVTDMNSMFSKASKANPDISNWNISNAIHMLFIFSNSGISEENYEKALIRFAAHATTEGLTLPQNISLETVSASYCSDEAEAARQLLVNNEWSINDQGKICD